MKLISFKLKNLSKAAQSHILHVSSARGDAELLFSYGELIGVFTAGVCNHLTGVRRTSQMHINQWIDERASAERGIGDLQSWMDIFFGNQVLAEDPLKDASAKEEQTQPESEAGQPRE